MSDLMADNAPSVVAAAAMSRSFALIAPETVLFV
jgi:hypothetical protein